MGDKAAPPRSRSPMGEAFDTANTRGDSDDGGLRLQQCAACGRVQYPPRAVCAGCLGDDLDWQLVDSGAELIAWTRLHASAEPYFQKRLPWRIGLVRLAQGPCLYAHLGADVPGERGPVDLATVVDAAGRQVILALPPGQRPAAGAGLEQLVKGEGEANG